LRIADRGLIDDRLIGEFGSSRFLCPWLRNLRVHARFSLNEADQLTRIFVAWINTARLRKRSEKNRPFDGSSKSDIND
jgi:hypothetical protein